MEGSLQLTDPLESLPTLLRKLTNHILRRHLHINTRSIENPAQPLILVDNVEMFRMNETRRW